MTDNGSFRNTLGWLAAVAGGAWLSLQVARWLTESLRCQGSFEPVREVIEEVLEEHRAEDTPMVHAFTEALQAEEAEETVELASYLAKDLPDCQ